MEEMTAVTLITKCVYGTIQITIGRKVPWNGKYIQLSCFALVAHKQGLVKMLFYLARNKCNADPVPNGDSWD